MYVLCVSFIRLRFHSFIRLCCHSVAIKSSIQNSWRISSLRLLIVDIAWIRELLNDNTDVVDSCMLPNDAVFDQILEVRETVSDVFQILKRFRSRPRFPVTENKHNPPRFRIKVRLWELLKSLIKC